MDRISGLSDELLIKILSFLPTKDAVSTSILSKQWEFLWMWLPKLEYGREHHSESEYKRLKCFLDRNLPLHRAPVIESFRLEFLYLDLEPGDIRLWVLTVVSRYVRELDISYFTTHAKMNILPSSLYTCKTLLTLKLDGDILVDVPRMVCLPALETLRFQEGTYFNEDSLQRLLSNCPVLKDLSLEACADDDMRKFIVIVPSLQRLTLINMGYGLDEFVISTPSLEYLKLKYYNSQSHHFSIENMPKLNEAYVDVRFLYIEKLIRSITSVKRLTLCQTDNNLEAVYGNGFVFNQLVNLKLCICQNHSSTELFQLLKYSPKLRVLDLFGMEGHYRPNGVRFWKQPSTVPECMLSSLRTFEFSRYLGRPEERDLVLYILKNSHRLKTATILSPPRWSPTVDIMRELALSSRGLTECELVFD